MIFVVSTVRTALLHLLRETRVSLDSKADESPSKVFSETYTIARAEFLFWKKSYLRFVWHSGDDLPRIKFPTGSRSRTTISKNTRPFLFSRSSSISRLQSIKLNHLMAKGEIYSFPIVYSSDGCTREIKLFTCSKQTRCYGAWLLYT